MKTRRKTTSQEDVVTAQGAVSLTRVGRWWQVEEFKTWYEDGDDTHGKCPWLLQTSNERGGVHVGTDGCWPVGEAQSPGTRLTQPFWPLREFRSQPNGDFLLYHGIPGSLASSQRWSSRLCECQVCGE